jgi:LemA protein
MVQLGEELRSTENKVAFARQSFNDSVTQYNTYRQTFPAVGFAGMFGHG